jgi:hypothetical protein
MYQLANFLIWFAYLVIAFSLYMLYRSKKAELPAPGLFVLGTLFTLIDVMAAAVSVVVACRMPSLVSWMVHLPAQEYVHAVNKTLEDEVSQTVRTKHELIHQVELLKERNRALENLLKTHAWISEKNAVMEELSRDLSRTFSDREMT